MASTPENKVLLLLRRATSETAGNYARSYWMRFNKNVLWEACRRLQIDDQAALNSTKRQLVDIIKGWIQWAVSPIRIIKSMSHLCTGFDQRTCNEVCGS
jgi:hypothetical protein